MTPDQEAAAFWGSAQNVVYPVTERLAMALTALEFFGSQYEPLLTDMPVGRRDDLVSQVMRFLIARGYKIQAPGGDWVLP